MTEGLGNRHEAIGNRESAVPVQETSNKINSYRDLRVWQSAIELTTICYQITSGFPESEKYGLTSQLRRSIASVAANIAEGYGREQLGSYVQFLRIAQGSLKEFETHATIACRVGFLDSDQEAALLRDSEGIGKMLRSLIRSLQRSAPNV
ncbi:MAG: four helix bundle protein [Rhizobiaceae bacterium]|nr:four helix bundle protein [Rhizobiaceae bacterium]